MVITEGKGTLRCSKVILNANECFRQDLSGVGAVARWIQRALQKIGRFSVK